MRAENLLQIWRTVEALHRIMQQRKSNLEHLPPTGNKGKNNTQSGTANKFSVKTHTKNHASTEQKIPKVEAYILLQLYSTQARHTNSCRKN